MNINEELLKLEEIYNIIDFQEFYTGIAFLLGLIIFTVFTFSKWDSKYEFYKKEIMSLTEELDYINEESYIKNDKDAHILDEINNEYSNFIDKQMYEKKLKKANFMIKLLDNYFTIGLYFVSCLGIGIYIIVSMLFGSYETKEVIDKQEEKLIELISENKNVFNISYIESVGVNNYKLGYYIDNEYNEMSYAGSIIFQEGSNIILEKFEEVNKEDLDNTYIGNSYSSDISFAKFKHKISINSKLYVGNIYEEELINNGKVSLLKNIEKDEQK